MASEALKKKIKEMIVAEDKLDNGWFKTIYKSRVHFVRLRANEPFERGFDCDCYKFTNETVHDIENGVAPRYCSHVMAIVLKLMRKGTLTRQIAEYLFMIQGIKIEEVIE